MNHTTQFDCLDFLFQLHRQFQNWCFWKILRLLIFLRHQAIYSFDNISISCSYMNIWSKTYIRILAKLPIYDRWGIIEHNWYWRQILFTRNCSRWNKSTNKHEIFIWIQHNQFMKIECTWELKPYKTEAAARHNYRINYSVIHCNPIYNQF